MVEVKLEARRRKFLPFYMLRPLESISIDSDAAANIKRALWYMLMKRIQDCAEGEIKIELALSIRPKSLRIIDVHSFFNQEIALKLPKSLTRQQVH